MFRKSWALTISIALIVCLAFSQNFMVMPGVSAQSGGLRIFGLVDRPLNLTYDDLLSFPRVSEVARLICVVGTPNVTYDWIGVPVFYLLTLAETRPNATKVIFRASDGFSSDLPLSEALKPVIMVAFGANGSTTLPTISGIQGLFRLVVPSKWGYKWVGNLAEIELVDYDYKGTYESTGYSDEADIPDGGPLPEINPPLISLNITYGNRVHQIDVFTNVSITAFSLDYSQKAVDLNVTVQHSAKGFALFILAQDLLKGPFSGSVDERAADVVSAYLDNGYFLILKFSEGTHVLRLAGSEFVGNLPTIIVDFSRTAVVDEVVSFDASRSTGEGQIISYEWEFGDGINGTGAITSHAYAREGTYNVRLEVTDDGGFVNAESLTVIIGKAPNLVPLVLRFVLVAIAVLLVLMLAVLLVSRDRKPLKDS